MAQKTGETPREMDAEETALDAIKSLVVQSLPLIRKDVMVASFAINLLLLAFPLVVLQVYDRILPNQAYGTLMLLVFGVCVALVLDTILKTARAYVAGWAGAHFEHQIGIKSIEYLLYADIDKIESEAPGTHLDRLAGVDLVRDFYSSQASLLVVDLPFVIVFLTVLGYISGSLALIPLALLILFSMFALWLGRRLKVALHERSDWDDRRFSFIIEALKGIHTIKSCAMEKLIERRYERMIEASSQSGLQVAYLSGLATNLGGSFSQITMASVVGIGSLYVVNGNISQGALAACMLLAGRTVQPVLRALSVWTRFQAIQVAEKNLDELLAFKSNIPLKKSLPEPLGKIELKNLYYRPNKDAKYILKGVNLEIEPGEVIGIKGGNGSGKTTLLRLMLNQMPPTRGSVLYNGNNANLFDTKTYRSQIAYLPQRPVLFEGTVLENITMFRGEDYWEEAQNIAEKLGLDKEFSRYPQGFDTKIGASAYSNIPGGVSQRIAIARALMDKPKYILFDEANTALDGPGDARIRGVLQYFKATAGIILITYRPSLLSIADKRYELIGGALLRSRENEPQKETIMEEIGDAPKGVKAEPLGLEDVFSDEEGGV